MAALVCALLIYFSYSMQKIIINTDGGARGNPGPSGIGVVIINEAGETLKEFSKYLGNQTNNFAEYEALILALTEVKKLLGEKIKTAQIEVRMDSELVVRQCMGIYKVKEPTLKEQFAKVAKLREGLSIMFVHVRREQNKRADELANEAMDEHS